MEIDGDGDTTKHQLLPQALDGDDPTPDKPFKPKPEANASANRDPPSAHLVDVGQVVRSELLNYFP